MGVVIGAIPTRALEESLMECSGVSASHREVTQRLLLKTLALGGLLLSQRALCQCSKTGIRSVDSTKEVIENRL